MPPLQKQHPPYELQVTSTLPGGGGSALGDTGLIVSEIARLENQSSSGGPDPDHSKIVLDKLKNDLNLNLKREYMLISQLDHIKLDQTLSLERAVEKKVQEIRILIGAGSPKSNFCIHCILEHEHGTIACTKCGYLTIHTSSSKGRLR